MRRSVNESVAVLFSAGRRFPSVEVVERTGDVSSTEGTGAEP